MLLFISGCTPPEKPRIYQEGRQWQFAVQRNDHPATDTLNLKILETRKSGKIDAEWELFEYHPDGKLLLRKSSETIFKEIRFTGIFSMFLDPVILIHPPSIVSDSLDFVPRPNLEPPVRKGWANNDYSHKTARTIKSVEYKDDNEIIKEIGKPGEFEDMEVTGSIRVTGKIYYDNPAVQDTCLILEAAGKSKAGEFTAKYYFHEDMGFVYFSYDFGNNGMEIILSEFSEKRYQIPTKD